MRLTFTGVALVLGLPVAACSSDEPATAPTWNRDVLPIARQACMPCHRSDGIAPFSMQTYAEVVNRAPMMADQAADRTMPPWPPTAECEPLRQPRVLDAAQIDTIVAWAQAGAPEGDPADAPGDPAPPDALESIDLTIEPGAPYTPRAGRPDDYHCFRIDPALSEDRDVVAYEVVPGTPAEVHHVILFQAPAAAAQRRDDEDPAEGWTCFGSADVAEAEMVAGWAPGTPVTRLPDGVGVTLEAGRVLVMQVHYNLANLPEGPLPDRTRVHLDLAEGRVARPASFTSVRDAAFAIPPRAEGYSTTATTGTEGPVDVWGVFPHMHTLGRSIRVDAVVGGEERCVIDIPRWDFHWQQLYLFESPIAAGAGDTGTLTCTWDNPSSDTVTWGEGTSDEMCINFYLVTRR